MNDKIKASVVTISGILAQQVRANDPEAYAKLIDIQKTLNAPEPEPTPMEPNTQPEPEPLPQG